MKTKHLITALPAASLLLAGSLAHGADINWNGFASIAVGTIDGDEESYTVEPITGGSYDDKIRFTPESVIGLQARASVSEKLSAIAQITAKGNNDSYTANFEWAYLSYALTDETTLNLGRFRLPLYYYSDFLDAAYAYTWIRPPLGVYDVPASSLSGINVFDSRWFGDVGVSTQLWYGAESIAQEGTTDIPNASYDPLGPPSYIDPSNVEAYENIATSSQIDVVNDQGINAVVEYGVMKARILYNTKEITFDGGESWEEIYYAAYGLMANISDLQLNSEYTQLWYGDDSVFGTGVATSYYLSAAYNLGSVTPFVAYSAKNSPMDFAYFTETAKAISTVGIRWDFEPGAAFKLELSQYDLDVKDAAINNSTNIISAAVDVVF